MRPSIRLTNLPRFGQLIIALLCAAWLALGGPRPAQATPPPTGALAQAGQPVRLMIPSLEIDAPIEAVGQDDYGFMQTPSRVTAVAWYNLGPRPGATGNAVMAGHLDDVKGRPAVFWRLDELVAGDEVIVRDGDKHEKRFEVVSVETYEADAAPMARIFGLDFERDLNLITCDGEWNAQSKLYEKRLVVYTRLIREDVASPALDGSAVATTNFASASANIEVQSIDSNGVAVSAAATDPVNDSTQAHSSPTSFIRSPIPPSPGTSDAR